MRETGVMAKACATYQLCEAQDGIQFVSQCHTTDYYQRQGPECRFGDKEHFFTERISLKETLTSSGHMFKV